MQPTTRTIQLDEHRTITLETGKLAKQADGSVVVRMGNTMLLATAVMKKEASEGLNFVPLSVDYQEKFAAAGKIPGSFLRREGRLGDHEVLIARLVDRAIRPLFPKGYRHETQINISLISAEEDVMPDALAALAASAALMVSPIPFGGPISEVRVARIAGEFCINPTPEALENADIDLMVGATEENIMMVEGEMNEVQEEDMLAAMQFAHTAIKHQCQVQKELAEAIGVAKIQIAETAEDESTAAWKQEISNDLYDKVYKVVQQGIYNKAERKKALQQIKEDYIQSLPEEKATETGFVGQCFQEIEKSAVRNLVLNDRVRLDGRKLDEVRPIWIETDYLPAAHGSALFTRGETQSLTTATLGNKMDEQLIDRALVGGYSKFMLHYNFPGFSTGEVKPNRGPARREIGHGNLALRALKMVMPDEEQNPYTVRVVSDILESNGSSSMATVCAGSLALMDAGVALKSAVSGIAMGLVADAETGQYAVLSDILGDEDFLGDMDFKVAGTAKGLTACQMDIKVQGLSYEILQNALEQSKAGRLHILEKMNEAMAQPREDYKPHVPRVSMIQIPKETIGAVIGPGGKVIQEIQRESGATVLINEEGNVGIVKIFATSAEAVDKATTWIKGLTATPTVGEVYTGKIKTIKDFGAFVEFMPGKDGLLHISEVKWERISNLEDILEEGEEIQVKLIEIDPKTGKYRLSRKALLPNPSATTEA